MATLQNLSLLASMQPGDITEAIEASATGAVGRTKLRLVYAAARLKFDLDPIDVGAPPPAVPAEPMVVGSRAWRNTITQSQGGLSVGPGVRSGGREVAVGGAEEVACEVQGSGR